MTMLTQYGLDFQDYLIFLVLHNNPLASPNQIAKELDLTPETIRRRITRLKKHHFLRPDRTVNDPLLGERIQTEVEAIYVPQYIGLLRLHVFFHKVTSPSALEKLIELCEVHPYTHYRAVTYGEGMDFYSQFDVPPEIIGEMEKLFEELKTQKLFKKYSIIKTNYVVRSCLNFNNWSFNFNDWSLVDRSPLGLPNQLETLWKNFIENHDVAKPKKVTPTFKGRFDEIDMKLLRELSINGKVSSTFLENIYDRDVTTISRRLKNLKEKVALNYVLYYDRSAFNLDYIQMVSGKLKPDDELNLNTFTGFLESGLLPFETNLVIDGNNFIWYMHTPSSYAPMITDFIWKHASEVRIYQFYTQIARTYYFYYENYLGRKKWRTDEEYVLDTPLKIMFTRKK